MHYMYKNKITNWHDEQSRRLKIPDNTILIQSSRVIFFESKLYDIFLRYQSARILIRCINNNDNSYWVCEEDYDDIVKYNLNGNFLESMIINYNIVVDLTWVITCLSIEICIYEESHNEVFDFNRQNEIIRTKEVMEKIEKIVKSPNSEEIANYFSYFNSLSANYLPITTHVTQFWNSFQSSEIRQLYNFIKHRGKPEYTEIYEITGRRFCNYTENDRQIATEISDVRKEISFEEELKKLIEFDEEVLFPYCDKLFKLLVDVVY